MYINSSNCCSDCRWACAAPPASSLSLRTWSGWSWASKRTARPRSRREEQVTLLTSVPRKWSLTIVIVSAIVWHAHVLSNLLIMFLNQVFLLFFFAWKHQKAISLGWKIFIMKQLFFCNGAVHKFARCAHCTLHTCAEPSCGTSRDYF